MRSCSSLTASSVRRLPGVTALSALALLALGAASYALAQETKPDLSNTEVYKESFAALMMLLVLAVLIENALALIFNWRVYLTFFDSRGVKTLIMLAVAYAAVEGLNVDVVASLVEAYTKDPANPGATTDSTAITKFLTTLILAGGSSGVNNIMVALGYRDPAQAAAKVPKPAPDKAWVAVRVDRDQTSGPILVRINEVVPAAGGPPPAIAGTLNERPLRRRIRELFLRDPNRFPQSGGYVVEPGKVYEIQLEGRDAQGKTLTAAIGGQYVFATGAIVDLDAKL